MNNLHIIAEDSVNINWLIDILINKLEIKNLKEPLKYLDMEIEYHSDDCIKLILRYYIDYLVQNFHLDNIISVLISILEELKINNDFTSE